MSRQLLQQTHAAWQLGDLLLALSAPAIAAAVTNAAALLSQQHLTQLRVRSVLWPWRAVAAARNNCRAHHTVSATAAQLAALLMQSKATAAGPELQLLLAVLLLQASGVCSQQLHQQVQPVQAAVLQTA